MFKKGTWDSDVPKSGFDKEKKGKKKKEIVTSNNLKSPTKGKHNDIETENSLEFQNLDFDKADEILLSVKKKKLIQDFQDDVREDLLFTEPTVEVEGTKQGSEFKKAVLHKKKTKHINNNIARDLNDNKVIPVKRQNRTKDLLKQNFNNIKPAKHKKLFSEKKSDLNDTLNSDNDSINHTDFIEKKTKQALYSETNSSTVTKNTFIGKKQRIKNMLQIKKTMDNLNDTNELKQTEKMQDKSQTKELIEMKPTLQSNRTPIKASSAHLREKAMQTFKAAQFRFLNERLYTSSGQEAKKLFQSDPAAFQIYHNGFQQQLKKWPINPLDVIVKEIKKMPKTHLIADMGCGEAALASRVPNPVRSFDLVAAAPGVEACDMLHTPLRSASMDAVVYCLALMGTELAGYLLEANRVLKIGGHLMIAEVESRFHNVKDFIADMNRLGFQLKSLNQKHKVFFFMYFRKNNNVTKRKNLPDVKLKPCMYQKRMQQDNKSR